MAAGIRTNYNVAQALRPYIVADALPLVLKMLRNDGVRIAFSSRKGRVLGYYMPPAGKNSMGHGNRFAGLHTISLQIDLNPYALLFVFVHEWAHLLTQKQYGSKVFPHGKEWKSNFKHIFRPFFSKRIFPEDILEVIDRYFAKTTRYFEKDLDDACRRYGSNRKEFARCYMQLLKKGVVIPAPYMGSTAQTLLEQLRSGPVVLHEEERGSGIGRSTVKKTHTPDAEVWREVESVKISDLPAGSYIRMEGTEYEVVEHLPPFVLVTGIDNGHKVRVHGLVQVKRIERLAVTE